jgi:hypothetical protein
MQISKSDNRIFSLYIYIKPLYNARSTKLIVTKQNLIKAGLGLPNTTLKHKQTNKNVLHKIKDTCKIAMSACV